MIYTDRLPTIRDIIIERHRAVVQASVGVADLVRSSDNTENIRAEHHTHAKQSDVPISAYADAADWPYSKNGVLASVLPRILCEILLNAPQKCSFRV